MASQTGNAPAQPRDKLEFAQSPRSVGGRPLKQMPSIQRMDLSNHNFVLTPASAQSTSSLTNSPSWSFSDSPYSLHAFSQTALPPVDNLYLGESLLSASVPTTLPPSSFSRTNGLTRKLSSGKRALSRLGRTASSGPGSRRDPSSGPVVRRRSDSKTSTTTSFDYEDPVPQLPYGLGLYSNAARSEDAALPDETITRAEGRAEVVAPAVPQALVAGSLLTKITKRKAQDRIFSLDPDGHRVTWTGTVRTKEFCLDNIKTIRSGKDAVSSWSNIAGTAIDVERCFTIHYATSASSKGTKTLHLLAPTKHLCRLWVKTVEALAKHREELMSEMTGSERQSVLRAHWDAEIDRQRLLTGDISISGLNLNAVTGLCRKLHVHCPRGHIEESFQALDLDNVGNLDFDQFRAFIARLRSRLDLRPLYNQLKTFGVDGIGREDFLNFLQSEQGIRTSDYPLYWNERFESLAKTTSDAFPHHQGQRFMDFAGFSSFITSRDCHIYASGNKPTQIFNRPLNEYFISSSHNTYLTGRQVNGTSSVEAYVTVLKRGCRSVEIDCWNGEHNQPRVTHGFTGTTSVAFVDVIRAINRCAFEVSNYPVILSLEVHCNSIQQKRMVEIMQENIDESKLLLCPLPDHSHDLPSPEDLMNKILIKVKATDAHVVVQNLSTAFASGRTRSTSSPTRRPMAAVSGSYTQTPNTSASPSLMMSPPESIASPTDQSMTPTSDDEYESDPNTILRTMTEPTIPRKTSKITQELAALGVYTQGYSYRSPADLAFQRFNHIFSINENTAITVSKHPESKLPFEKHNASYLCRIYPRGTRINSSNFDPNTFWRRGVQMVALNWQTYDIHMQMNQAMFASGNDRMGYVLKPEYLRNTDRFGSLPEHRSKLPHQRVNFTVKLISAQQLPLLSTIGKNDLISPFVEVQMFSAEDKARGIAYGQGGEEVSRTNSYHGIGSPFSRRTKTVPDNGFNPQFNDVIELSLQTKYPELVFVRFVVYQHTKGSPKELAVFTAKLDSLQRGYRHLPLYNSNGEELIFSTLFCHITKEQARESIKEDAPVRTGSIRKLLSRSNTTERGRARGQTFADGERQAAQKKLNAEIEAKRR